MLDLVQIRAFIAVATELHFGRAARRLNMTQPPLSRQIRLLEQHLGAQLLERSSKSVSLTPAGISFLPEARALISHAEDVEAIGRRGPGEQEGTVRLGFYTAACARLLPRVMARAEQTYPGIRVLLREGSAAALLDAFAFGELDLGIVRPTNPPKNLSVHVAMSERLLLALPPGDELARRRKVRLLDLEGRRFIAYEARAPYMHALQNSIFAQHGVRPRIVHALSNAQAILSLVGVGLGAAILPEHACHVSGEGTVFRALENLGEERAKTHLLMRSDARDPAVDLIHALILEVGGAIEAEGQTL